MNKQDEHSETGALHDADHGEPEPLTENVIELGDAMAEYESKLLRYVGQILWPDRESTQDVVQDTFLRLHRQIADGKADAVTNLASWLYRVAHNLAMDVLRKRKRDQKLEAQVLADPVINPEIANQPEAPTEVMARRESCEIAVREMQRLPEEQKQVLLLKIMEGLTLREISEITGMKIGTVNYRLTQGLMTLADRLRACGAA